MLQEQAHIIQRILEAFETRTLAADDPVFGSETPEIDGAAMRRYARGPWVDVPHEAIIENPMTLSFATAPAFAFFLPAFMIVSIAMHSRLDNFTATVLSALIPSSSEDREIFQDLEDDIRLLDPELLGDDFGASDLYEHPALVAHFLESAAQFNPKEKAAIRDYLLFVEAHYGQDFPVFGPRQALERYWQAGRMKGGGT